jgi:hypothetical protein
VSRPLVIAGLYAPMVQGPIDGMAPGERLADAELWTLNDWHVTGAARHHRPDRVFNLHDDLPGTVARLPFQATLEEFYGKPYDALATQGTQIWLSEPCARFPAARIYPFEGVRRELALGDWFFSSSLCYMLALAYHEGRKEIAIRRVMLDGEDEYRYQALGLVYALHLCDSWGVSVDAPMRLMWEQRFTDADLKALESGEARDGIYRIDVPYHRLDRFARERLEAEQMGKNKSKGIGNNLERRRP